MRSLVSLALVAMVAVVHAISSSGSRLLVIMDDVADKANYSHFLGDLEGRGYKLSYETPKSDSVNLIHLGERSYDHILLFPIKSKGLGPQLTPNILLDFLNLDGNILLTLSGSQSVPTSIVSLLLELDIELPADRNGLVVDHFSYAVDSSPDDHDVLVLPVPSLEAGGLGLGAVDQIHGSSGPESRRETPAGSRGGNERSAVLAFPHGVAQLLGSGPLIRPILRAPPTAYSYNPKSRDDPLDDLFGSGPQLSLVSALQARNSARFTVSGSADMLSDKWLDATVIKVGEKQAIKTANREFAKQLSGWTFKETGVLRVNNIEHRLNEPGMSNETNPKIYRIKNDVTYSISLSEYSWDKYIPFTVPEGDELQLEFSMLSPFHRLNLKPTISSEDSTTYSVSFKLPDQHGIFNFLVNYKRPFFSNVFEKNTVSVRHFAHDEWPRSFVISGAWPWIAGIGATVAGWLGFCAIWLYSAPPATKESKKTR
ncbi:Dolichyl-diphosphooligosaccharide--protein glycosyltransferase subunit WBP1 [Xylariaceae sp. FL1272]|nr:Dolichyl-diphosphooligosaccharide--protein glycosyltransferase subunit WBP1 [Xylariaceae sp. FL1272]